LKRKLRLGIVSFIVGSFMVFTPTNAFAEQALAEVTCAKGDGTEQTFSIGWDNSNSFFDGKGEIPRLYCEGGFAQPYNFYVRDNLPLDSPLRWYNGVVPLPTPSPEPVVSVEPTPVVTQTPEPEPTASVEPTLDPEPTPIPEPTQTESPSPEPTVEPSPTPTVEPTMEPSPTPIVTPDVTPVAEPTPSPSQESVVPVPVEPTPEVVQESVQVEPTPSPSPTIELAPEITPEPQPTMAVPAPVSPVDEFLAEISIELPSYLENVPGAVQVAKAAEAIMAIGSDMTPEQREESQGVVVAAVIVGQLAQVRRLK
jgi:hypothetical protein